MDTLVYNGNPSNRINIVILGDGYTSSQMQKFKADALANANYFLKTPPFNIYKNYFNFFAVEVISSQSDIDHPGNGSDEATYTGHEIGPIKTVNTYLNTTFDYQRSVHRLIASASSTLINTLALTNLPLYDYITVIANTSYYGGSGGTISYASMETSATEIFMHEFGHSFGLLQDEYNGSSCAAGSVQKINVSQVKDTNVVWKKWLTKPYPSYPNADLTNCDQIGIYLGGNICNNNWYHPKCYCKMRVLDQPFCEVCTEQLIYRLDTSINYINSYSPASLSPKVCKNTIQNFSADIINTTTNTVRAQWYVNGNLVVNNATSFAFNSAIYTKGTHTVKLVVQDTSLLSKKRLAVYTKQWTVTVTNGSPVTASAVATNVCVGDTIKLTAANSTSYNWTFANGSTSTVQNPKIPKCTLNDSGIYTVVGTSTACNSSATVRITVNTIPNVVITGTTPIQEGNTLFLSATGGNSFNWTGPNLFSSTLQNPQRADIELSDSGFYIVNVSNNGCSKKDSIFISVYETPQSFSKSISERNINSANFNHLSIYPNPTQNGIWIQSSQEIDAAQKNMIEIYSVSGSSVLTTPLNQTLQYVDFNDFPKGIYLLKIKDKTVQIVKQ
ncbi:MAG: M64 family metallopeptidase [Chitinophagales bacterium]